jgi:uncharacterized protein (TIGR02453 family)
VDDRGAGRGGRSDRGRGRLGRERGDRHEGGGNGNEASHLARHSSRREVVAPVEGDASRAWCDPVAKYDGRAVDGFVGFTPAVRAWFDGLEEDNSRGYFTANRNIYDAEIRGQMEALLDELTDQFGGEVRMFRQHRDIRFSRDKSPYKTSTYGIIRGAPQAAQGLYASVSAHGLVAGSGYHVMARDQLERYREHVDDDRRGTQLAELAGTAEQAGLELWGGSLATAPRGYPRDHARIELLRRTSLTLGAVLGLGRGISREAGLRFVAATWRAAAPVTGWLDQHVGPTALPAERGRRGR